MKLTNEVLLAAMRAGTLKEITVATTNNDVASIIGPVAAYFPVNGRIRIEGTSFRWMSYFTPYQCIVTRHIDEVEIWQR